MSLRLPTYSYSANYYKRQRDRKVLLPNVECANCSLPIYRKPYLLKTTKTGKFYCGRECSSIANCFKNLKGYIHEKKE